VGLVHELNKRGFRTAAHLPLAVNYDGQRVDLGFRIDILVESTVVVEIKAVDAITLSRKHVGLLIKFNGVHLRDGIRRMV
jgi:GxxExxY protein